MTNIIHTRLVKIGNSQGVRIPKTALQQLGLSGEIELEIQQDQLIIRSRAKPRAGWAAHFRAMAEAGDDALLDEALLLTDYERDEGEWQ